MRVSDRIAASEAGRRDHAAGAFPTAVLGHLEALLPAPLVCSAETGCGKTTIWLSNLAEHHTVFALDDRSRGAASSVRYFEDAPLTRTDRVERVLGPTQVTLPRYTGFRSYDLVLLDGPHAYPFPELEYLHLYPHLRPGGLLIVDDVHIATVGRLADFVAEDPMFAFVALVGTTAVFRRTDAPTFDPLGDGWWEQPYNQRRIPAGDALLAPFALRDGGTRRPFRDGFPAAVDPPARLLERLRARWRAW